MIGEYTKFLDDLEQYFRDLGEYDKAAKINETMWFLWETWDQLVKSTISEPRIQS